MCLPFGSRSGLVRPIFMVVLFKASYQSSSPLSTCWKTEAKRDDRL